jgi:AraC-like DNA-binding protein
MARAGVSRSRMIKDVIIRKTGPPRAGGQSGGAAKLHRQPVSSATYTTDRTIIDPPKRPRMPSSSTFVFSEPDEFEVALRKQMDIDLLVTGHGQFRSRLTRVALHRLHLEAGEEMVSRIAFMSIRPDFVLVWWVIGQHGSLFWCGEPTSAGEIMTLGPGGRAHARTEGPSRWAGVWIAAADLANSWRVLTGTPFKASVVGGLWQPRPAPLRTLRTLHAAAIKMFESRPNESLTTSAIHGLEQQLIHALVKCLSDGTSHVARKGEVSKDCSSIMLRFEEACATYADRTPPVVEICALLDIPARTLRRLCQQHIGMGPMVYLRLRRMNSVRRALSLACPADSTVAELARRHGFTELGRFAATYRKLFGELPSATLQQKVVLQSNSRCIDASRLWT